MSPREAAPWILMLAGGLSLWPLQRGIDATRAAQPRIVDTLPPREVLPVLACGHGGAAANLLEIQTLDFLIDWLQGHARLRREHLFELYRGVMALDPEDPLVVERAAIFLWTLADSPVEASQLIDEGLERVHPQHPHRWRLYREKAGIYLLLPRLSNWEGPERERYFREAGRVLMRAADLPNMPESLVETGQRLLRRGLSEREALVEEGLIWDRRRLEGEPELRERAAQRLLECQAAVRRLDLESDLRRFLNLFGRLPWSLDELGRRLKVETADPLGHGYLLADMVVYAPAQEAATLERLLRDRLARWRRLNPAGTPTLADLRQEPPPPYLDLTLTREEVHVTPRPLTTATVREAWEHRLDGEGDRFRRDLERAKTEEDRLLARARLAEASAAQRRWQLQVALDGYRARHGQDPADLAALEQPLRDPLGFGFILHEGRVVAPALDALRLHRMLRIRFERAPQARTARDLGLRSCPPWLGVRVEPGAGVAVVPLGD